MQKKKSEGGVYAGFCFCGTGAVPVTIFELEVPIFVDFDAFFCGAVVEESVERRELSALCKGGINFGSSNFRRSI